MAILKHLYLIEKEKLYVVCSEIHSNLEHVPVGARRWEIGLTLGMSGSLMLPRLTVKMCAHSTTPGIRRLILGTQTKVLTE